MEKAVAGVMGATSKTVETVLSHIPGTAEHAVAAGAKQAQREEERQRRHEEQHEKNVHFNEGVHHPEDNDRLARHPTPTPIALDSQLQNMHTGEDLEFSKGQVLSPTGGALPKAKLPGVVRTVEEEVYGRGEHGAPSPPQHGTREGRVDVHTVEDVEFTNPSGAALKPTPGSSPKGVADVRTVEELEYGRGRGHETAGGAPHQKKDPSLHSADDYAFYYKAKQT